VATTFPLLPPFPLLKVEKAVKSRCVILLMIKYGLVKQSIAITYEFAN
jgi:hypothetical protein